MCQSCAVNFAVKRVVSEIFWMPQIYSKLIREDQVYQDEVEHDISHNTEFSLKPNHQQNLDLIF